MKRYTLPHIDWPRLALPDLVLIAVYATFVHINRPLAMHGDLLVLFLVLQEACVIGLALTRRRATATCIVGGVVQIIGQALALSATLALGRSFGIVAANRGVQTGGLYRIIRHPLYAAYLLAFGGFVLAHPSRANSILLFIWLGIQVARIHAEERLLDADASYRAYAARVRFRLLPGIW